MHRALAILPAAALWAAADEAMPADAQSACERDDLRCWQQQHASECSVAAATLETCLVFLQRLELVRSQGSYSSGVTLVLGETLHDVSKRETSPQAKERYLRRSRAAFADVVRNEPLNASGYLGLAEVAASGEERVDWLRGAVRAEHRPAHMELLARALSSEIGGHAGDLEAARVIEDAYTHESKDTERWRYGAEAWQRYTIAVARYPSALDAKSLDNVVLRIEDDIDYALLQRVVLEPEAHLAYLADAFSRLCEKSIAAIVTLDECMAGLELAVAAAERPVPAGSRRLLAEAVLVAMRTVAGEALPRSLETRERFAGWLDRLLKTMPEPVEVSADLLEARADYTSLLLERVDALVSATELSPNRGDLRLKLGATYVSLRFWAEALDELRVAKAFLPLEDHERVDRLFQTADERYQARFYPPAVAQ